METNAAFVEHRVQADGFMIRYLQAGDGPPLVHLHGAGGLRMTRAHDLLSRQYRVIVFEMPGFGAEENTRTQDQPAMAATMAMACDELGLGRYWLIGTSFGARVALWQAVQRPDRAAGIVLEAPAAIRPDRMPPAAGSQEEIAARLYAHPERMPSPPRVDPGLDARRRSLVARLRGPARDAALEASLAGLTLPVLAVFGTRDAVIPPEMGRLYKDLMPEAHLAFVYDAGHAVAVERPEAFAEIVEDFLEREDAFLISRARTALMP